MLVIVASGLVPVGLAKAADLAFPVMFIPVWSQDENIFGAFTDTRITVFNPSKHCPIQVDPGCVAPLTAAGSGSHLQMIWFGVDEDFITVTSQTLTAFDVTVVTGQTGIPAGAGIPTTGTAIFVNTLTTFVPPVIAFFHPLAIVVEIGVKAAPGPILDPVGTSVKALTASEAQLIPALFGEFPRVEVSAGVNGAPLPFPPDGWETVIVETCLTSGTIQNVILDDNEKVLYDITFPCTGLDIDGPDVQLFTPDDGGLLGTGASASPLGNLKAGYNRLAIDVNTFGGFAPFGTLLFHGQAFVVSPGVGIDRQAYSYNMPANYFVQYTAAQTPAAEATGAAVVTEPLSAAINFLIGASVCPAAAPHLGGGQLQVETFSGPVSCTCFFEGQGC
jgi:hypothetical protein